MTRLAPRPQPDLPGERADLLVEAPEALDLPGEVPSLLVQEPDRPREQAGRPAASQRGAAVPPSAERARGAAELAPPLPKEDPITRLPLLVLFPHSRCNCRCLMCDIWRDRGKRELAAADVARWLPEWRRLGVERVVLSGGEALLHSELWRLCDLLRGAGIGITVLSTGLLLARDAERLVAVCDDVVVSLDGPRQVHDLIRNVPRAFDRLAEGVAAVRAAGGRGTRISGRCTVQRANFHALRATVAAAREIGLDRLSFLAADVTSEAFNRPGGWNRERAAEVALREEDLEPLAAELAALARECAGDFAGGFLAESPRKLERRLLRHFAALLRHGDFAPNACNAPWVSAVIEADGTVRPCFFQPALGRLRAGGVGGVGGGGGVDGGGEIDGGGSDGGGSDGGGSLAAILNSPAAIAWRRGLDIARDAICRRCVCSLCLRRGGLGSWAGEGGDAVAGGYRVESRKGGGAG
jgi:Fe-coproporphyrin III synthase